uniref:Uncharacterized protein n=1 Tax=viral metagenome TaxID=1070528 RepID=A0A6C0K0F1_9ZZZZ
MGICGSKSRVAPTVIAEVKQEPSDIRNSTTDATEERIKALWVRTKLPA